MATNSKSTQGLAIFGRRVINQIWTSSSSATRSPTLTHWRAAHTSVDDKNTDDQVHPNVVPDYVIPPQSDKYWAPHPQTGVFGPATTEQHLKAGGEHNSSSAHSGQDSVLEEKAWFRPTSLEDLEKPHHP